MTERKMTVPTFGQREASDTVAADFPTREGPARERLLALDVFRGITVAGMLLVNNPGSWSAIYPPLAHAPWHGWTPTDLIFPFFLFIVGITTALSINTRHREGAPTSYLVRRVIRRGMIIIGLGLLLNSFPFYMWGTIDGLPDPTFAQRIAERFAHLRFPGVLQRIGVVYLITGLLAVRTSVKQQSVVIVAVLFGYWAIMTLVPVPDSGIPGALLLDQPSRTLAAYTDRLLLGENHLWRSSKTWDPEGPLSTIPAIATGMLGLLAGQWLQMKRSLSERIAGLSGAGALLAVSGLIWHWLFPINKNLWTSSYVLFTAGMACMTLATCLWLIDALGARGWTRPFVPFGVNPMLAFVGSGIMARLMVSLIKVPVGTERWALQKWIYVRWFEPWLSPVNASLLYALAFVAFWWAILAVLHRRRLIWKV